MASTLATRFWYRLSIGNLYQNLVAKYGFDFGDEVLVQVADRLRATFMGRQQACVARVGGDEFAVLVDHVDANNSLSQVARRIRLHVTGQPLFIRATKIWLGVRTTFRRGPSRK